MQNVLTPESVVQGVLEAIETDGPNPPSARQLAQRLHVAPATLYGTVRSLDQAYSQARSALAERATGALLSAIVRRDSSELCVLLNEMGPQAVFLTDPRWPIATNPMLDAALARAGLGPTVLSDVLAIIGATYLDEVDGVAVRSMSQSRVESLTTAYLGAVEGLALSDQAGAPSTKKAASSTAPTQKGAPAQAVSADTASTDTASADTDSTDTASTYTESFGTDTGELDLGPVLASLRTVIEQAGLDDRRSLVRFETARLVAEPEAWSFRTLSDATDLAVSRLHRFGSRTRHLSNAIADLAAAVDLGVTAGANAAERVRCHAHFFLSSGAGEALAEVYHHARIGTDPGASVPLSPEVAAVVVAHRSELRTVDDASELAARLHVAVQPAA